MDDLFMHSHDTTHSEAYWSTLDALRSKSEMYTAKKLENACIERENGGNNTKGGSRVLTT